MIEVNISHIKIKRKRRTLAKWCKENRIKFDWSRERIQEKTDNGRFGHILYWVWKERMFVDTHEAAVLFKLTWD